MRGTEFFNYGKSEVADGHTPQEYATKQKEDSLNKAGKIDVNGFLKDIEVADRCIVKMTRRGEKSSMTLDKGEVYTIWYNEAERKWMIVPSKIRMGE